MLKAIMREGIGPFYCATQQVRRMMRNPYARPLFFAIEVLPVFIPAALAAFGAVTTLLLLFGQLQSAYVWPFGLPAAAAAGFVVLRRYPRAKLTIEQAVCSIATLGGVLAWGTFNIFFTAQHLATNRDPGTYTNAAIWLVHHTSLMIHAPSVFGAVDGISTTSPGFAFNTQGTALLAQGQHVLPALLGLAGRVVGIPHMLHLNVLFGMTALLAVYGFARLLVRPFWAMIITGVLAASMPFIYFSRDTYTEPLAATFTFGALALLWVALRSKRLDAWFLAGLVAAAGTMTRIDGYLTIAALLAFAVVLLATAPKAERPLALKQMTVLIAGMLVTALIGWLDVVVLSTFYYQALQRQFYEEMALIGLLLVAGPVAIYVAWHTHVLRRLDALTKNWRPDVGALTVIAGTVLLMSRALWSRSMSGGPQSQRSYAEISLQWVTWYAGPVLAVLGAIGLALSTAAALRKRNLLLTAALLVVGGTTLVYLVQPGIAPDQIWASRRLVPVILPGVAIFGAVIADWLARQYESRIRCGSLYVVIGALALLMPPLITSRPLLLEHDTDYLAPVMSVCSALPEHAAVLWVGIARSHFVQPTLGLCGAPSAGYGVYFTSKDRPSRQTLAAAAQHARAAGYLPIIGLYGGDVDVLPVQSGSQLSKIASYTIQQLDNPVANPPTRVITSNGSILLGVLQNDGVAHTLDGSQVK